MYSSPCSRYAASGAAYSAATTSQDLSWCRAPDKGLPAPDLVLYLNVPEEAQRARADWGAERFERAETQRQVGANFKELARLSKNWAFVEAGRTKEAVHADILERVLPVIEACKDRPVDKLYED